MRIDVFTLFPEWFEWFRTQRHVRNVEERGSRLALFNYRDSTPLSGGQVDDAPYGGGAGMVLRVDVVDAALRSAYGGDGAPGRVICARVRPASASACASVRAPAMVTGAMAPASVKGVMIVGCPARANSTMPSDIGMSNWSGELVFITV